MADISQLAEEFKDSIDFARDSEVQWMKGRAHAPYAAMETKWERASPVILETQLQSPNRGQSELPLGNTKLGSPFAIRPDPPNGPTAKIRGEKTMLGPSGSEEVNLSGAGINEFEIAGMRNKKKQMAVSDDLSQIHKSLMENEINMPPMKGAGKGDFFGESDDGGAPSGKRKKGRRKDDGGNDEETTRIDKEGNELVDAIRQLIDALNENTDSIEKSGDGDDGTQKKASSSTGDKNTSGMSTIAGHMADMLRALK